MSHKGKPRGYRRPIEERIMEKVAVAGPDECWLWKASTVTTGRPYIRVGGRVTNPESRQVNVARWMYDTHIRESDPNLDICHTCDNPLCVNPAHLFEGTNQQNVDDKMAKGRHWSQASEVCMKGLHPRTGSGTCRECQRATWRRYYHRHKTNSVED